MVGNRLGIPADAVDPAVASRYFLRGRARWWSNRTYPSRGHRGCEALPRAQADRLMMGDSFDHLGQIEQAEDVTLDLYVSRDVAANQAELVGCPQQSTQPPSANEHHRG